MNRRNPSREAPKPAAKLRCCVCRRHPAVVKGRCRVCYRYRWQHGYDRPPELVEKEVERDARKVARLLDGR